MRFLRLILKDDLPEPLKPLVFEVQARTETPLFKLFERLPRDLVVDRFDRRRFLISGTTQAFRHLIRENPDLKFAKGLLLFLVEWEPSLVSDLIPRHGIIPPQDLMFFILPEEEIYRLSPALKARHIYFGVEYLGPASLAVEVLRSRLPFVIKGAPEEDRHIIVSASIADLLIYLLNPLRDLKDLREDVERILEELKKRHPDCFGEGG